MEKLIDEYISLKKDIDAAKAELEGLASKIKEQGPGTYSGKVGSITVTAVAPRKLTKWELVCAAAKVPQKIIDTYTTLSDPSLRINVKP